MDDDDPQKAGENVAHWIGHSHPITASPDRPLAYGCPSNRKRRRADAPEAHYGLLVGVLWVLHVVKSAPPPTQVAKSFIIKLP